MRTSQYLFSTLKETPAEAAIVSHQLMLRAGMIRPLASGLYNWMPTGWRVLRKVEKIIREEMDKSGALEIKMPVVQPAELWEESGRWEQYGPELLRFEDRGNRNFVLGPTHEEVITDLVRREVSSYKQLPINLYQIQTKFRWVPFWKGTPGTRHGGWASLACSDAAASPTVLPPQTTGHRPEN
mgnify:CR=1 FL=1